MIAEYIARYYNAIVWAVNRYLLELLPRVKEKIRENVEKVPYTA